MNTILFRTDANSEIGTGHAMRCFALAQAAHDAGHKPIFLMIPGAEKLKERFMEAECEVRELSSNRASIEDAQETANLVKELDAKCVVDGYDFADNYQRALKSSEVDFLIFDDYGHAHEYSAKIILNQNSYAPECTSMYANRMNGSDLLLGCEYVLLRREFRKCNPHHEIPDTAKKILISLGGGDTNNMTQRIVELLQSSDLEIDVTVVIGSANKHKESIASAASSMNVIVDAQNMPELMMQTDLAIAAGGTTSYELAYMGVPTILFELFENQRKVVEDLGQKEVVESLGRIDKCSDDEILASIRDILINKTRRKNMSEKGHSLVDGKGVERVLTRLLS
ncbi:MAG: UDP-2,4-diacetamido-2,4,6-trideoxy-beta-L-altropyranose hydrolase [Kiritimatiellales bacterium]|nr:UDP-2,4-diacetamido-2,4,6-trideoxy-beta-L-altropyranose hydrolase [Kiritimatiellales bacterium]